jgi:hypothetical protein
MKQDFIHIFICNNLITAIRVGSETSELVFSNVHLSNLDKVLAALFPYHHLPMRLVLNTPTLTIKSFNTKGMNWWHQYQLIKRLAFESESEWYASWKEQHSLMFVKGNLSDLERAFINELRLQNYLIKDIIPALWCVNNLLLMGHEIKENGVVFIPISDQFQQILFLQGIPTISRIINTSDTTDWIQFVKTKHQINLEVLDTSRLISSLGKPTDSFSTFILDHLPSQNYPNVVFNSHSPRQYYIYSNRIRNRSKIMIVISSLYLAVTIPNIMNLNAHQSRIDALMQSQIRLLYQYPLPEQQDATSKAYAQKRQVVEAFNAQTFPTMYFLERISTILPQFGQVIYIRISPSISRSPMPKADDFSVHLRIVPAKSSKNLQLLTSELHKLFGEKLQVHIVHNPQVSSDTLDESTQLKHAVQINMTGQIHELQRLTP